MQVEEGLCDGAVLYHAHVTRSKAQVSAQQAAKDEAARLKAQRRQQQEDNVRRKEVRGRRGREKWSSRFGLTSIRSPAV